MILLTESGACWRHPRLWLSPRHPSRRPVHDKSQEDVNGEKLTVKMKKWWIFGADFFTVWCPFFHTVCADFSRFVRDINGEKKSISLSMSFFTVSFSRFAPSRKSWLPCTERVKIPQWEKHLWKGKPYPWWRQSCFSNRILVETNFEASKTRYLKVFWSLKNGLD